MKPETKFRNSQVIPFLRSLKNTHRFAVQQVSINGTPDFLLCSNGVFIALELKSKGGKTSALQQYHLEEVTRCGGVSLVAYPENWNEIKKCLLYVDTTKGESNEGTSSEH